MPKFHTEQTKANKIRRVETIANRREVSRQRREARYYVVPTNAMIKLADLPRAERAKLLEEYPNDNDENGKPIVIPDPMRGISVKGTRLQQAIEGRIAQAAKIEHKRKQRAVTRRNKDERAAAWAKQRTKRS